VRTFTQPEPLNDTELDRLGDFLKLLRWGNGKLIRASVSACRQSAMETKWLHRCRIRLRLLDLFFALSNSRTLERLLRGSATLR
jgi:hypothetical protein